MHLPDYSYVYAEEDKDLQREIMRYLCKTDLWFLLRNVLGYEKLETQTDIHYRVCQELQSDPHRYLFLIPRGYLKTSIMMGRCIQKLLIDPSEQIGIGSDTVDRSRKVVDDLRDLVQTELLVSLFPEIFYADPEHQSSLWTKTAFNVQRPPRTGGFKLPSVTAFGFDPMPTGSHYTFVWIDDLENDDNSRNLEQIDKLNANLSAFFPILPPTADMVMTGTIWAGNKEKGTGPMTVYQTRPGWKVYKRRVREGDGHRPNLPTYPSYYTDDVLDTMESDMNDPFIWAGQFLLDYLPRTGGLVFTFAGTQYHSFALVNDHIIRGNHIISLEDCLVYVTIDPSGGVGKAQATTRHDKVGWCVNAVSLESGWHLLEVDEEYLDDEQFIDKLFELYQRWSPFALAHERMPWLEAAIRKSFKLRNQSLPISEVKPKGRRKQDRIRGLKPLMGSIYLREGTRQEDFFKRYYTTVEHGDDAIDACAYQIDIARPPTRQQLLLLKEQRRHSQEDVELALLPPPERKEYEAWIKNERLRTSRQQSNVQSALEEMYDVQTNYPTEVAYDNASGFYH
jgi:hypothetical protein